MTISYSTVRAYLLQVCPSFPKLSAKPVAHGEVLWEFPHSLGTPFIPGGKERVMVAWLIREGAKEWCHVYVGCVTNRMSWRTAAPPPHTHIDQYPEKTSCSKSGTLREAWRSTRPQLQHSLVCFFSNCGVVKIDWMSDILGQLTGRWRPFIPGQKPQPNPMGVPWNNLLITSGGLASQLK